MSSVRGKRLVLAVGLCCIAASAVGQVVSGAARPPVPVLRGAVAPAAVRPRLPPQMASVPPHALPVRGDVARPLPRPLPRPQAMDVHHGSASAVVPVSHDAASMLRLRSTADTSANGPGQLSPGQAIPLPPIEQPNEQPDDSTNQRSSAEPVLPGVPESRPRVELGDVLASVDRHFPLLLAALEQRGIAAGDLRAAWGNFDLKVSASGYSEPLGFYQYHKANVQIEQPTWWGGKVYSGYRLGRGFLPLWFGDDQTNDGGELRAGFEVPLWQDRPIDKRRADLRKAEIARQAVLPGVQRQRIEFLRAAAQSYWDWVAARQALQIADELLQLARDRDQALRRRVERGDLAEMQQVENQSLIVQRQLRRTAAERKFLQAGIKLSLFLRDPQGFPVLASPASAPKTFPAAPRLVPESLETDLQAAVHWRPELRELVLERQKASVELAYADNLRMPTLDAGLKASQDVGQPYSPKRDKSPFELEGGVYFDVPVQRRQATGQARAAQAKLAQIAAKQRYYFDKVQAEVRDASVTLETMYSQIAQAIEGVRLARRIEALERRKFELGGSNLLFLNLREQATADARTREVETVYAYFLAWADYRAAVARDVLLPPGS